MKTLQEHYNAIKNGQGNKDQFLKQARNLFPNYFNQYTDFNTATNVLKSKQIISEAAGGVVSKGFDIFDWKNILAEEIKAEEKKVSKEVEDYAKSNFDNKDMKNADNINFNEILKGYYAEMKDPKNADKTGDELKDIVVKNLAKDALHYTKDGEFGVKGVGYTTETPGLGTPKEPKGKHKSSGYGDLDTDKKVEKVKANVQDSLGEKEAKTSMPKKVKEMEVKPQNASGVKKMAMPGKEKKIKLQENTQSDFDGTGLIVVGRTQIDNNKITDMLDETDFHGIWNVREGYWFFPEAEETLDTLEKELENEFSQRDINARFESQLDESKLQESSHMGDKGAEYMISKSGSKTIPYYILEKPDGSAQIDMMFSSPEEAKKYANKKELKISSKKGVNLDESKERNKSLKENQLRSIIRSIIKEEINTNVSPKALSDEELEDELREIGFGRPSPQNQKRYKELHDEFERRANLKNS